MGEEIAKFVWKSRLALLIGALILILFFAALLQAWIYRIHYGAIYIIAFGVSLGLVDTFIKKSFPEVNEQKGCAIIFILIMLMIILW
ncbi:MAG: hypothetical protein CM15mP19_05160 [Gammaproteobacteria bacterium]|nr:MAG: hypothetical protein CM15mP19_05160 [Gammaproteobacteria bacterium]